MCGTLTLSTQDVAQVVAKAGSAAVHATTDHDRPPFTRLTPQDKQAVLGHLQSLSPADLRLRFCSSVSRIWLEKYCAQFFERPGDAIGVWHGGALIGLGECRAIDASPLADRDIGISVLSDHRGHGIGTSLATELLRQGFVSGCSAITLLVCPENKPMRAICKKLGASVRQMQAELEYRITRPRSGASHPLPKQNSVSLPCLDRGLRYV